MSLDYDTTNIRDRKEVFPPDENGKMNDTLHVLIWNALAIDVGTITEDNVDEVWYRTDMWQRLIGAQFQHEVDGEWQPFLLTREDVVKGIGLHTNVGPASTRHQFIKKVTSRFTPSQ